MKCYVLHGALLLLLATLSAIRGDDVSCSQYLQMPNGTEMEVDIRSYYSNGYPECLGEFLSNLFNSKRGTDVFEGLVLKQSDDAQLCRGFVRLLSLIDANGLTPKMCNNKTLANEQKEFCTEGYLAKKAQISELPSKFDLIGDSVVSDAAKVVSSLGDDCREICGGMFDSALCGGFVDAGLFFMANYETVEKNKIVIPSSLKAEKSGQKEEEKTVTTSEQPNPETTVVPETVTTPTQQPAQSTFSPEMMKIIEANPDLLNRPDLIKKLQGSLPKKKDQRGTENDKPVARPPQSPQSSQPLDDKTTGGQSRYEQANMISQNKKQETPQAPSGQETPTEPIQQQPPVKQEPSPGPDQEQSPPVPVKQDTPQAPGEQETTPPGPDQVPSPQGDEVTEDDDKEDEQSQEFHLGGTSEQAEDENSQENEITDDSNQDNDDDTENTNETDGEFSEEEIEEMEKEEEEYEKEMEEDYEEELEEEYEEELEEEYEAELEEEEELEEEYEEELKEYEEELEKEYEEEYKEEIAKNSKKTKGKTQMVGEVYISDGKKPSKSSGGHGSWHFFTIFLFIAIVSIVGYLCVYNRKKIREGAASYMSDKNRRRRGREYKPLLSGQT